MSQQAMRQATLRSALAAQAVLRKERADQNAGSMVWRLSCCRAW